MVISIICIGHREVDSGPPQGAPRGPQEVPERAPRAPKKRSRGAEKKRKIESKISTMMEESGEREEKQEREEKEEREKRENREEREARNEKREERLEKRKERRVAFSLRGPPSRSDPRSAHEGEEVRRTEWDLHVVY